MTIRGELHLGTIFLLYLLILILKKMTPSFLIKKTAKELDYSAILPLYHLVRNPIHLMVISSYGIKVMVQLQMKVGPHILSNRRK